MALLPSCIAVGVVASLAEAESWLSWHHVLLGLQLVIFGAWVARLRGDVRQRKAAERRQSSRGRTLELLAAGAPLPRVLESIVTLVEEELPEARCSVALLDRGGKNLGTVIAPRLPAFYNAAVEGLAIGPGVGSCGTAASTGKRVIVEDVRTHPAWAPFRELTARADLAACWSEPILSSEGKVLGTYALYHRTRHQPGEHELRVVEQAAHLASIAIEKSTADQQLRDREAHFRLLTEDVADVVWKTDASLRVTYISPADERQRGFTAAEIIGRSVLELFTEEGVDIVKRELARRVESEAKGLATGSVAFDAPHRCKDGHVIWGEVVSKPTRDGQGQIIGYHGITREITERRQMQEQVRQLAYHDPLTRLPNRRLLSDRLGQALAESKRHGTHGALMFLDLDRFKALNDLHGHEAGDLLLVDAANRLRACVREVDTVARLGGDEFIVLLSALSADRATADAGARTVAEKIRLALEEPWPLTLRRDGAEPRVVEHRCSASIGVAVFSGAEGTAEDLLKWADAAMYLAKSAGRNQVRFHASPEARQAT